MVRPTYLWQWSAHSGNIAWSSLEQKPATASSNPARNPGFADPLVQTEDSGLSLLSELLGRIGAGSAFSGVIAGCAQHTRLRGARIAGFRTGDVASGVVYRETADEASPQAGLTCALLEGIEALPEAFVLYDEADRMIICNEQYRRLYPLVADMMTPGMYFPDIVHQGLARGVFRIEEDSRTWAERRISFHQAGIGFFEQHLSDGRWIQVSERRTASGGTTSIRADITVLKERERDLRAARARAEAEIAARTAFIAKVGHELRNPLNVIFGIAQLLAGEVLSKPHQALIESLFDASRAMRDVLNDILDVAGVQAGRVAIRWEATECRPLLREMVNIARTMADQKGLAFRARIGAGVPDRIATDPRRLRQILFNLLGNAVKYTTSGTISITVSVRQPSRGSALLRVAITDSGPGISSEFRERAFAPHTRQGTHVAAGIEGLGLGLSISEELAQAIGARVGIEAGPDGGTRAWVDLPVTSDAELPRQPAPARPEIVPGPPLDILIVDDEQTNLIVADALLKRLGHRAMTAPDAAAGLQALREGSYHVVLLDIAMPDVSGIALARRIVDEGLGGPQLAIIAMTGNVMPEDVKAYLAAGFTGFVEKPVDLDDLAEALAVARRDLDDNAVLRPGDRLRFPRAEPARAFDRMPLDRMVADIGHGSVASIVGAGVATFRQAAAALGCEVEAGQRLLHKVHAVAGLLGLDALAALTLHRDERGAERPTPDEIATLREELDRAAAQMELYALNLAADGRGQGAAKPAGRRGEDSL